MHIDLSGKTAVITGGSRGLGEAMAKALSAAGAQIALVARDAQRLEKVRGELVAAGGTAAIFTADVTREEDVAQAAEAVTQRFGAAQILINNAGINIRKNMVDYSLEEFRSVLDSSLTSTFLMSRAFVPGMKGSGYGRILNMTSIMSHVSLPGRTAYSSAKSALLGFTRALALELAGDGITVNGISPGLGGCGANAVEGGESFVRQFQRCSLEILAQMLDRRCAGDQQHVRRPVQQPRKRYLHGSGIERRGYLIELG
jgi:NAD(P)-dependent dehydrogenase (short-subunit alcohol dehydrogenase family)